MLYWKGQNSLLMSFEGSKQGRKARMCVCVRVCVCLCLPDTGLAFRDWDIDYTLD